MDKNDFNNEIKKKFDECPELPDSLKKENIVSMIKNIPQEKTSKVSFKRISAVAAAVCVVLLCGAAAGHIYNPDAYRELVENTTVNQTAEDIGVTESAEEKVNEQLKLENSSLRKPANRQELEKIISENFKKNYYFLTSDDKATPMAPGGAIGVTQATVAESFNIAGDLLSYGSASQTNIQTQGVDEADIVKNDGTYLYVVGYDRYSNNKKLKIIDTRTMQAVYNSYLYNENGDIIHISEIFVRDNILVAVGSNSAGYYYDGFYTGGIYHGNGETVSIVMDISDKSSPRVVKTLTQDGSYISSRMIDGYYYAVSEYFVSGDDEQEVKKSCVPEAGGKEIACDCIYIADEDASSYICLTAIDTNNPQLEEKSIAVLGKGYDTYCSEESFYVVGSEYLFNEEGKDLGANSLTNICSFSLNGTDISFKAQGEVKGRIVNQYSLDEYKGNLRIATTYYDLNKSKDVSCLYVLDGELKTVGKIENLADDEQIKSVRFMGDKANVVTFRETDPLFTIDLSVPGKPKVVGELKLPGYSAYLHPISDSLILGVGYDGDESQADFNSLKISLFDISDMANPKEVSSLVYDDCRSYVCDSPKAFIYNSSENYIVLPVQEYDEYSLTGFGCYIVDIKGNSLSERYRFIHEDEEPNSGITFLRGAYTGDSFFSISDNLAVKFSLSTGEKVAECRIYEERGENSVTDVTAPIVTSQVHATAVTSEAVTANG